MSTELASPCSLLTSNQLVGSILAVSSGLPVGKEGPLLHIGASVAAMIGDRGFLFGLIKMRSK